MKNQTSMGTEVGRDTIAPETYGFFETSLGPVRSAAPVKLEHQPAWLDGMETRYLVTDAPITSVFQEAFSDENGSLLNDY